MISETKIDDSFPIKCFLIDEFSPPLRSACDVNGENMFFVMEDILANPLATENAPLQGLHVESNLRNTK